MPLVIIGSKNPVKIKCVEAAFNQAFPSEEFAFQGAECESGVSDQPMSNDETYQGAYNRALATRNTHPEAKYWVGIEGGIAYHNNDMEAFAWIVILSRETLGKSRTASFVLPIKIKELVEQGVELGIADDMVFERKNSKQLNGAVGILTNDLITRISYYEQAVMLALIPFMKPSLYQ